MQDSTIAAIATAPGAGGIAVVRLSGPESYAVAARVFRPANPDRTVAGAKGYTALFGTFLEGEDAFDEGVALFFRAPHSYTGEDVVELSCHGGSAVARRLVDFLSGVAYAGDGKIKKVSTNTYIITPYSVDLMGDLIDELENNGLYL